MTSFIIYCILGVSFASWLGRSLKRVFTPEQYKSDWYGYTVNQIGHAGLGVFLLLILNSFHTVLFGEFLIKWQSFVIILLSYGAFEIHQNGKKWDMIEDLIFVMYGVCGCLYAFNWIGGSKVCGDTKPFLAVFFIAGLHLLYGVIKRTNYAKV